MQKILYILRHAKAERVASGQEDHERGLTPRGAEDAQIMGKYMAAQGIMPDLVLCSTAVRTRETWTELQMPDARCRMSDKLYLASANEILNFIAATPEPAHSLMVIGHNPGLHDLCLRLAKDGNLVLLDQLAAKFPTGALATIVFDEIKWQDIGRAQGTLTGFIAPKIL